MKTTSQIYEQDNRISRLLWEVTSQNIKRVHPDTGGNLHLAHNWGNDEAQKYLEQHSKRQSFIFHLFQKYYFRAFVRQYPNHTRSKAASF